MILRSSHWRRSAKIFEYVFFKIANLQRIQLHLCSKSMKNTCEGVNFSEKLNSFAVIFWKVLAQLQNRFFVEHLSVAAYVCCLKEKEWKKWNSVFLKYSVWHSSLWYCKVQSGKKEQIKNISASKMKQKIKNCQLLLVLTKKRV